MPRVKRGVHHNKRRKAILKLAKGFELGKKKLIKLAKTAVTKAGAHAYRGRKEKKRRNRQLWQIKINAGVRKLGLNYSQFIDKLNKNNIKINRKILAELAEKHENIFKNLVEKIK